ncbi:MAG: hypothetical protein ACXWW9_09925 [Actinomycetota bacterium]
MTFIDSNCLHALLEFATVSFNGNGPLRIANPSRTVLRVMDIGHDAVGSHPGPGGQ